MSTLLFERSLPRFAAARVVSTLGSGGASGSGRCGWSSATRRPSLRGMGPRRAHAVGHLWIRPGHLGRPQLPLLRGHRLLPLRAGPRGRRHGPRGRRRCGRRRAGHGHPGGAPARLGCTARGIQPPLPACQAGNIGNCGNRLRPHPAGAANGFCADTGGGWSTSGLVAHSSQLYEVPEGLSDMTPSPWSRSPAPCTPCSAPPSRQVTSWRSSAPGPSVSW